MPYLRLSHVYDARIVDVMTSICILGGGRMGSAIADRLRANHSLSTWTRSAGGSPADAVRGAEIVLLCLYDGAACRDVLSAIAPALTSHTTVVNTTTCGPTEAHELEQLATEAGAAYLHAPVLGSTPAATAGTLTLIAGREPSPALAEVLGELGETLVTASSAEAAALKLVANGVLGDLVDATRRALGRAELLDLGRPEVLRVLGHTLLGPYVADRHTVLESSVAPPDVRFTIGALRKDLGLLAEAIGTSSHALGALDGLVDQDAVKPDSDVSLAALPAPELSWLADAHLDVSPEIVADPAVLRPLYAYAHLHATGDPAFLIDAFHPTARVDGYRGDDFVSMNLQEFATLFTGPATTEAQRTRRIERLDVRGAVATAVMRLRHVEVDFADVFVLVRRADGEWRIASKAYQRLES